MVRPSCFTIVSTNENRPNNKKDSMTLNKTTKIATNLHKHFTTDQAAEIVLASKPKLESWSWILNGNVSSREKCAVVPVNQTEWRVENVDEFVILGLGVNGGRAGHY